VILNIGLTEHGVDYYMGNTVLPVVTTCHDLGITVTNDLAPSQHINDTTVKAHQCADSILRCFVTKDTSVPLRAYTVHVRPILEYNCVVWSPHLKQDIDRIAKVQGGSPSGYQT